MPVEPCHARRETFQPIVLWGFATWKGHRASMRPRADDEARGGGDLLSSLSADLDEVIELSRQERIVPAGHEQHRDLESLSSPLTIDIRPVLVPIRMVDPVVEKRNVASRPVIGFN